MRISRIRLSDKEAREQAPVGRHLRILNLKREVYSLLAFCLASFLGFYFYWVAPRKLVHLKWKSLGKLEPGGTREQETDRRRSDSIVEPRKSRPETYLQSGCADPVISAKSPGSL